MAVGRGVSQMAAFLLNILLISLYNMIQLAVQPNLPLYYILDTIIIIIIIIMVTTRINATHEMKSE